MHKIIFIKKTLQELIRFLGTNICVLMVYKFCFLPIVGGTHPCGGTYPINPKCDRFVCSDGTCPIPDGSCLQGKDLVNTAFWDGYCLSVAQGYTLIALMCLLNIPVIIAAFMHRIPKRYILYVLIPSSFLVWVVYQMIR